MGRRNDTARDPERSYPYVAAMRSVGMGQAIVIAALVVVLAVALAVNAQLAGLVLIVTGRVSSYWRRVGASS